MITPRSSLFLALVAGALPACAEPSPDELAGEASELRSEDRDGGIKEVVARRYLVDPDVTMASYAATGVIGSCSATLIGPNLVMGAAHCGMGTHLFEFKVYRNLDPLQRQVETMYCRALYQTFDDTDLALFYCPPINGVNPGDKFGYLDLEHRSPVVGDRVYSIWKNPVLSLPSAEYMIYSDGVVQSVSEAGWMTPVGFDKTAVLSTVWGMPGASGSAQLDARSHRVLVGPLSVAFGGDGGAARWALSMFDYLRRAAVNGLANVNAAELTSHGLVAGNYLGAVDKNGDGLFDVQVDLERRRGEARRDHYALSFTSERKNALWDNFAPTSVKFQPADQLVHFAATGGPAGLTPVLRHSRLNLAPGASYRFTVMVHGNTTTADALAFQLEDATTGALVSQKRLSTTVGAGWVMETFVLSTGAGASHRLTIAKQRAADFSLVAINIIQTGSVMDFDTMDKRFHWRNDNDGRRAFVIPDGTGTAADWAALVFRTDTLASGNDWPVRNRQMALVAGQRYRMCFQVKKFRGHILSPITGTLRVKSGNLVVVNRSFAVAPSGAWAQVCTDVFTPPTSDNNVQLGIFAPRPDQGAASGASYLVDDLQVIQY